MLDANFWHDKSSAQKIIKEKKLYENLINSYENSIKNHTFCGISLYLINLDSNINYKTK